jgi:predicted DsbA family dithiol-disulfide isomerase
MDITMARTVIPIYFDYASTLCYVAWRIVGELRAEIDFDPLWKGVPIRMRDGRTRPGNRLGAIEKMKIATVIAETGVAVTPLETWIDSQAALEGAELARAAGRFDAYHDAVFRAVFEERRDISDMAALGEIAAAAGLDRAEFVAGVTAGLMRARLEEYRREADNFSALGYPAFVLGDYPLTGIQPKETMRLVLARYLARRASEPTN